MDVCKTLFSVVLNMSLTGGIVIASVMLVRLFLRRMPRKFSYLLWGVVLLRLLCPISFSSVLSVFQMFHAPVTQQGRIEYVPQGSVRMEMQDGVLPVVVPNYVVGTMYETVLPPVPAETEIPAAPLSWGLGEICGMVWLLGIVILWLYSLISIIRLRRQLVGAVPREKNIYLCDHIGTAFVLGVFRPRIYLPTRLAGTEREYILLHEQTHIRRGDHILRLLAFLALSLHWFNPLVWCAFRLSERDMEMSCDEAVMEKMGLDLRAAYSTSLVNVAGGRQVFAGAPLGFGEGNVKCRVRNIMKYRKTAAWIACPALIVIAIVFLALGSNPTRSNAEGQPEPQQEGGGAADSGQPAGQDGDGLSGAPQAEGGSPGTPQADHSAPGARGDAPQTSGDVVQIAITTPVITDETPCGADQPQLDYADKNILIFHDYFGLFVYDRTAGSASPAFLGAVALEPIGCHYTQGASYCDVRVSKDGRMVYLHPLDIKDMYVYDVQNRTLIRTKYDLGGVELFDGLVPTEECVEAYDGGYSEFSVSLGDRYLTLEYKGKGGMAMNLYAVIWQDGREMGFSKLLSRYGEQELAEPGIFGYMGYTGYLDECLDWDGYEQFVGQDYDGDGLTDRVYREDMGAKYRIEFGNGDLIEMESMDDGMPAIQTCDLDGDGVREILFQQFYYYSTDPNAYGETAIFEKKGGRYVQLMPPEELCVAEDVNWPDPHNPALLLSYEWTGESEIRVTAPKLAEGSVDRRVSLDENLVWSLSGETGACHVCYETVIVEQGGKELLEFHFAVFNKWSLDEIVVTAGYENGGLRVIGCRYVGEQP